LILLGGFQAHKILGGVAVLGVVLGAAYMLWMVKRVFFGTEGALVAKYKDQGLDINFREVVILVPFILLIFWMGLFPNHFLSYSKASLDHFVNNMSNYELKVGP
ncbi:MAG TPA: Fe-S-binding domain-containing protein, partial [Bdellovibrionales bacterium]|nr:Fe-S-binding domain-containing protein [Bdellovibrionales bacterium]